MNAEEMGKVLGRAAYYDYRDVTKDEIAAWLVVLGGLTYEECDAAVVDYYRRETRRLMPADIWQPVMEKRQQWLNRHPNIGPRHPEIVPPWENQRKELT